MKILIAVPCMDMMPRPFVESILSMDKPENTNVRFLPNSLVYDARNMLSLQAIQYDYDWILWLDSDMVVPQDTLPRLLADAKGKNADIVTGLYVMRTLPAAPVIYSKVKPPVPDEHGHMMKRIETYTDYPKDTLFPVAGCGFGCVLTSVPLLKDVWDEFGPAFHPLPWAGEDLSFCWRADQILRRKIKNIWCDSSIRCGHVGQFMYTPQAGQERGKQDGEK